MCTGGFLPFPFYYVFHQYCSLNEWASHDSTEAVIQNCECVVCVVGSWFQQPHPAHQSLISLTGTRWGCVNQPSTTHAPQWGFFFGLQYFNIVQLQLIQKDLIHVKTKMSCLALLLYSSVSVGLFTVEAACSLVSTIFNCDLLKPELFLYIVICLGVANDLVGSLKYFLP